MSGLAIASVATRLGLLTTLAVYLVTGFGYGVLCWLLARTGYLAFPRE